MRYEQFLKVVDEKGAVFRDIADFLWENPEIPFHEYKAAQRITEVLEAEGFAKDSARLCGLPLLYSTIPDFAVERDIPENFKVVRRYVHFVWEDEPDF